MLLFFSLVAICTGGCGMNKECTAPQRCTCVQGWTGEDCLTGIENDFVKKERLPAVALSLIQSQPTS